MSHELAAGSCFLVLTVLLSTSVSASLSRLKKAASKGRTNDVLALLQRGIDPNQDSQFGCNVTTFPLGCAAEAGQLATVKILIANGADINHQGMANETALYGAAFNGHAAVVEHLLSIGANPTLTDTSGETPLSAARRLRHANVVELLLARKEAQERQALEPALSAETAGARAEAQGDLNGAVARYHAALRALGSAPPRDIDERIRSRLLKSAAKLRAPLEIPEAAERLHIRAMAMVKRATPETGYERPIAEFNKAVALAPWWGAAYFNLALVLEQAGRPGDAIRNLNYYLLADPEGADAQDVKRKIIELEVDAEDRPEGSSSTVPPAEGEFLEVVGASLAKALAPKDGPKWVGLGTEDGFLAGNAASRAFHAVGIAQGIRNRALAVTAADDRSAASLERLMKKFCRKLWQLESSGDGRANPNDLESECSRRAKAGSVRSEIADHWKDPSTGHTYALRTLGLQILLESPAGTRPLAGETAFTAAARRAFDAMKAGANEKTAW